ncbi:MAG: hypothetical protein P8R54_12245 [Myxococcota bacterium]|nr:hypothetical protein [Myxococcota bacterium]
MPSPFPITIDDVDYPDAGSLASEIARRGDLHLLQEAAWSHPSQYFERWMHGDDSGRVTAAIHAASQRVVADSESGDAFEHAVRLVGSDGDETFLRTVLDRVDAGLPATQFWGGQTELSARTLDWVQSGVATKLPDEETRFFALLARHGRFHTAVFLCMNRLSLHPAIHDIVRQWAGSSSFDLSEVRSVASFSGLIPGLTLDLARDFADAPGEVRDAFLAKVQQAEPALYEAEGAAIEEALASGGPAAAPRAAWNHCQGDGLLANTSLVFADDQRDFYGAGRLDLVPCSHLVCTRCGEVVRHVDHREPTDTLDVASLYDKKSWGRAKGLRSVEPPQRFYGCRCIHSSILSHTLIETHNAREDLTPLPWTCGGHPATTGFGVVNGLLIEGATAIEALVEDALRGLTPQSYETPWEEHGAVWLLRLYGRLEGNPIQSRVSEAVGVALTDSETEVRAEALIFFLQQPFAPGSEALMAAAVDSPELFQDVHGPDSRENESLEFTLLRVLGSRYRFDRQAGRAPEPAALEFLRQASLRPHLAGATLPTLADVDLDWVMTYRMDIARASDTNALAIYIWIGNEAPEHEAMVVAELKEAGLIGEDL